MTDLDKEAIQNVLRTGRIEAFTAVDELLQNRITKTLWSSDISLLKSVARDVAKLRSDQ